MAQSKRGGRTDRPAKAPEVWRAISALADMDPADLLTLCRAAGSAARYADEDPGTAQDAYTLAATVAAIFNGMKGGQGTEQAAGIIGYIDGTGPHRKADRGIQEGAEHVL